MDTNCGTSFQMPSFMLDWLTWSRRLYLIPGADAPLEKVYVGEDKILLIYLDGRARLWNAGTGEFWGTMTRDKAQEMGRGDQWKQW